MYLVFSSTGARLCQDMKWRSFANYGTFPECVLEYRSLGHARRRANRYKGAEVVHVPPGMEVDACGDIIEDPNGQAKTVSYKKYILPRLPTQEEVNNFLDSVMDTIS